MSDEVTATVIQVGDVQIDDFGEPRKVERAVVMQFDDVEELKRAIAATARVRLEWPQ